MKKWVILALISVMLSLSACGKDTPSQPTEAPTISTETTGATLPTDPVIEGTVTEILLSDDSVTVAGNAVGEVPGAIYISRDIVYHEDRDAYDSGNPYGEAEPYERHSAEEADAHLVVNITRPGNYRLKGKLSQGQIRIDLGDQACEDPGAVVNLLLDGVDITSTVAPAILFRNVYECDGNWAVDTASSEVDTSAAGANLILVSGSENVVYGSHVAKIFQDKEGEKKLWKQDGAIYSYMSMNVGGTGSLDLHADNEGLDTELHLTINGGNIKIFSGNDGINTNEDGVSVTTINGGNLHIIAGLREEGDGIDSNGYLVINDGTVVAMAHPAADAGLDSDLGSFINGGTVIALGSAMDWAESDSGQITMNLQFAQQQNSSAIVVTKEDGTPVFAYDPGKDKITEIGSRGFSGVILSCADLKQGESYLVYLNGEITGSEVEGVYDPSTIAAYEGGIQQVYTGTDLIMGPGMGGFGEGQRPETGNFGEQPPEMPGNGEHPEMPNGGERPEMPKDGDRPEMPNGEPPQLPEGESIPQRPGEGRQPGGFEGQSHGEKNTLFYMQDKVNFFSGLTAATAE